MNDALKPPGGRSSPLVALSHRNFRLLWVGLLVSNTGSFMQSAALLWHVALLAPPEKKGLALGLVGLVRILPILFFSLVSGVLADAADRRRVLLATQCVSMGTAFALAFLAFRGTDSLLPIYILAAIGGAATSFDLPARQALVPSLIPRQDLENAISLNTIMFQIASVLGPALGGLIIGGAGVGVAYVLNAVSFLFVIGALLLMRDIREREGNVSSEVSVASAVEGLRFVFRSPMIRTTMLIDFFATFFSSATALLPLFAQDILHVGARGYGWLYAAPAVGALVAGVAMVPLIQRIEQRGITLLGAVLIYGLATVLFGLAPSFFVAFLCLALTGASDTVSMVIRNVIRQMGTPDHLRGRMSGVNMVFFVGGPQLGEFEAGLVAQGWGARFSVVSGGIACILATIALAAKTPTLLRLRRSDMFAAPDGVEEVAKEKRRPFA